MKRGADGSSNSGSLSHILMKWSLLSESDAIGYGTGSTIKARLECGKTTPLAELQLDYLQR